MRGKKRKPFTSATLEKEIMSQRDQQLLCDVFGVTQRTFLVQNVGHLLTAGIITNEMAEIMFKKIERNFSTNKL